MAPVSEFQLDARRHMLVVREPKRETLSQLGDDLLDAL